MPLHKPVGRNRDWAETLAIQALAYISTDPERLGRFLAITGIGPDSLRSAAKDPQFLAGVLDHVLQDEPLLVDFAKQQELKPAAVVEACRALGGAWERDIP